MNHVGGLPEIHAKVAVFLRSSQNREISRYSDVAIPTDPNTDGENAA